MAARHEIVHIEFQANAGKANAALDALRMEASRAKTAVEQLKADLAKAKKANLPIADIEAMETALKKAKSVHKQWQDALNNNLKGVRALDEAIKAFNSGKGSVEGMNAALSKTAKNAAELQKNRSKEGSKTWNEMVALSKALEQNILRCNSATNQLVGTVKSGGTVSRATLTQAKTDLQQMLALENEGTNAWKKYSAQLKVIDGALTKMNVEQQQLAGKNVLAQVFKGEYITKSRTELEQMIAKLREYQGVIADPEGKGARHFQATQTAIAKLSEQLQKTKVDAGAVKQALQVAGAAGTANRFGSGLAAEHTKLAKAFSKTSASLAQLKQQRETYTILQQNGITLTAQEQAMLAKLDAQITTTTARQDRLRNEMIQTGNAQKLTTQQINESITVLRQQQETVEVGSVAWQQYQSAITNLETKMKIMKGEAMSLRDAMRLSTKAGGTGFSGTAQQLQMAQQAIEKAMNAAKKGSPEWLKYQQALAKVRVEMQNTAMTSERMRTIIAKPANAKNLNELAAAIKRAKAELDLMAGSVGKTSAQYTKLAEQTKKAEIQFKQLQAQSHGTASSFDKAWSRLKTYIGLYMGAAVAIQKLVGTMSDLMVLSDKMGEVGKTTQFSAEQIGRLSENLKKLDVRTSLTDLMTLAAKAGQLGLKTEEDVFGFTEAANKMMIALPEMGAEAATEMMKVAKATGEVDKIRKQMQEGTVEGSSATAIAMTKIASTIDQLRAKSAAAAPQITDFVKRVGAVGAQSGITIDQVAALGSTVDALGMRVEMSATALSRMIPAIRNNAFAIAQAINVSPEVVRSLFDAGRGMEVILMILQHIKDTGKDADSIEAMLGMGNMKEIMKELNQQGARAGIVFAGLSQNVDMLREHLGIASEAYEENIAIEREFLRMNDTTAARWAKLKNQLEEAFVGDTTQRLLGGIIKGLRWIVDFLTENLGPALNFVSSCLKTLLVFWSALKLGLGEGLLLRTGTAFKSLGQSIALTAMYTKDYIVLQWQLVTAHNAQEKAAIKAKIATLGFNKALKANVIMAFVAVLGYLALKWYEAKDAVDEATKAMGKMDEEINKQTSAVNTLFHKLAKLREQERVAAEHAEETAKAEAEKTKAVEQTSEAIEDYMKKISLVDQLEQQQADTEKFLMDNLKGKTQAVKEETKAEEERAEVQEKVQQQSELITQLEEKRASVMDFLNQQHLQEVVVTNSREKAMEKLRKQSELINQLEEKRAEIQEFLNQKHLQEVVVIGDRTKALKKLWQQNGLITQLEEKRVEMQEFLNQQHLQEVVVIGDRTKALKNLQQQNDIITQLEERRAATMEFLNSQHLQEVVVIGDRTKALKNLQQQSELITQLEDRRAATMEFLNAQHMQEVTVTGDRTKSLRKMWKQNELITQLEEKRAEMQEFMNQKQLQEVVVIGNRTKALRKLWEQNDLVTQMEEKQAGVMEFLNTQHLQEVVIIGDRAKAMKTLQQQSNLIAQLEEKRTGIMEMLNQKQLQEVVIIGDRAKAMKTLQQQNNLIAQLEEKRADVMEFLNQRQLQEVVVTGDRAKAINRLRQQNVLINQMEERRAGIMEFLNQKQLEEVVVIGDRTKAMKNLQQQSMLITQLEERSADIMEFLNQKQLQDMVVTGDRTKSIEKLRQQSSLISQLEEQRASIMGFLTDNTKKLSSETENLSGETEKLSKKEEEAAEQSTKVEEGMRRVNIEGSKSADIIRLINSKYGTYLGYMISETSSAEQLARARELINSKLRETITLKQQEAALGGVEQEYGGKVNKKASSMEKKIQDIFGDNYEAAARVSVAINEAAQKYANDNKAYQAAVQKILKNNSKYISNEKIQSSVNASAESGTHESRSEAIKDFVSDIMDEAKEYREVVAEYQHEMDVVNHRFDATANINRKKTKEATVNDLNAILGDWKDLVEQYRKAEGEEKEKLAVEVYKQQRSYANAVANNAEYFEGDKRKEMFDKNIKNMKTYEAGLRKVAGEAIRTVDAMERAETQITDTNFTNGGESAKNPFGTPQGAESTAYAKMNAEQLVNRRKQMKDFVNAIQTDTDVQSVLKEDAALKKAIENGMSSDMRTVIEWYNTERLKIQDELHARHLTNTGDWMDPKKERGAKKQFRDEMDAYLHELDAYYTERKTRIEEAGTDEGLTEAEIRNRTLNNEMEWQQRRAELQKLYSRKQKEVTEEELNAIYHIIAERTGDSEKLVKAQIAKTNQFVDSIEKSGEKGAAIVHRWMSQVELDTERSYLKGQQALTKQMRAIEAIIDKERPFNGITKNLQESLATMDILTGEMRKEYNELMKQGADMTKFNERQNREEMKRTAFLLGEAENAYSTTIDHVMDDMRQKGMTAWADWLSADPKLQEALMAQLRSTYDSIQDAIKKEASQLKKQAEIMWNNILMPDGKTTLKQQTDRIVAQLGLDEGRVKRANSLIGAGQASERVADKLAIQQMKVQLAMQEHYYNLMKKQGQAHVDMLNAQAKAAKERGDEEEATRKTLDAQHAQMSLNLATAKEETELAKQREDIIARTEETQNRLYTSLKEWSDLFVSSIQSVMEASNAGNAEYYNELAKLNLTGKGGPGAGTYIVIDNEGTEDATAHYEYLNQREALERQHEIERENAQAEAWRKVMDDINMKLSETITDQLNAMMQNQAIDANTAAVLANTQAIYDSMGASGSSGTSDFSDASKLARDANGMAVDSNGQMIAPIQPTEPSEETSAWKPFWQMSEDDVTTSQERMATMFQTYKDLSIAAETEKAEALAEIPGYAPSSISITDEQIESTGEKLDKLGQKEIEMSNETSEVKIDNQNKVKKGELQSEQQMTSGNASMFAKMTQAANLYGAAYQAMSNDNLDTAQKFEMIALQAAGQAAIAALNVAISEAVAKTVVNKAVTASKDTAEHGSIVGPILTAISTAVLGGLMGLATSAIFKSKSQIAQVTGASASAGRMATGMLTYAEGNVNEFSDPKSLTPGRMYSVDAADGRTYRAKYTGTNPKTHITNGPEFHLSGEKGREMIIDAGTTRQITMNDNVIWQTIKTLSSGGRMTGTRRRTVGHGGMRAFADGNVEDFEEVSGDAIAAYGTGGFTPEMLTGFQQALERNSAVMEQIAANGIEAFVSPYGPRGVVAGYDKAKKEAMRHGEKYL